MDNVFNNDVYNKYFGTTKEEVTEAPQNDNIREEVYDIKAGNIGDLDTFAEILGVILNAAWGENWGEFGPEFKRGDDAENVILPQITYDVYNREVTEKMPIKPVLTGSVEEVVDGKKTGDVFQVYRQWFDLTVEFNVWGKDTFETKTLSNSFEDILMSYAGYFKKKGISEMFFLKEISSRQSDKFIEGTPMKSLLYYFKLERIHTIRISTLEKIDYVIKAYEAKNRVKTLSNINTNKITYDL